MTKFDNDSLSEFIREDLLRRLTATDGGRQRIPSNGSKSRGLRSGELKRQHKNEKNIKTCIKRNKKIKLPA